MARKPRKERKFNGKTYHWTETYIQSKESAKKVKKAYKDVGYAVRTVKCKDGYRVYIRDLK